MNLLESANCIVCGLNIDPELAIHNTGVPDCCDLCRIEQWDKYKKIVVEYARGGEMPHG